MGGHVQDGVVQVHDHQRDAQDRERGPAVYSAVPAPAGPGRSPARPSASSSHGLDCGDAVLDVAGEPPAQHDRHVVLTVRDRQPVPVRRGADRPPVQVDLADSGLQQPAGPVGGGVDTRTRRRSGPGRGRTRDPLRRAAGPGCARYRSAPGQGPGQRQNAGEERTSGPPCFRTGNKRHSDSLRGWLGGGRDHRRVLNGQRPELARAPGARVAPFVHLPFTFTSVPRRLNDVRSSLGGPVSGHRRHEGVVGGGNPIPGLDERPG